MMLEPARTEAMRPDGDETSYWAAVKVVQQRPAAKVWPELQSLVISPEPELRALVPDVLRRLGGKSQPFLQETVRLLRKMLKVESSPLVLSAIASAFVDLGHKDVVELLLPLTHHESAEVRLAAVHGLLQAAKQVTPRFIELTADPDDEVRSWTLFVLGTLAELGLRLDSMREAFAGRLEDPHEEARAEAVLGLARFHDARAVEPTKAGLERGATQEHYAQAAQILKAAGLMSVRVGGE